ncbi:MAG: two-component regulator propeller domain-containing protein [Cyclobacteriaceae bacterium]
MRYFLLVGLLVCLVKTGISQQYSYSIRNYKALDGLPQSQVNIMLEDKNGYLWIGTHGGGLARFDGRQFKVYTTLDGLLSNIILYLKLDSKQNLWIIHPRGISKFDGVTFKKFTQPGTPVNSRWIRRAFELQDTLFFISVPGYVGKIHNDSLYYWAKSIDGDKLVSYSHLMPDSSTLLYINDSSFRIKSVNGEFRFGHKHKFDRLYKIFNYQNKVWVITDKGAFTIDFDTQDFLPAEPPVKNPIVHIDTVNDVFWTRYDNVLMKEKLLADGTTELDSVLKDVEVTQVLVDVEGNTWLATHGMGLYKYFIQDFDRIGPPDLQVVMAIHRDSEGATWIGSTTKGLWKVKNGKVTSYFDRKESFRNEVHTIAESPDNTLWIGTSYGLGKYNRMTDSFTWYTRADGLSSTLVVGIQFDETGNMYLGTFNGGMNYYDGNSFRHITIKEGLSSDNINALHYSRYYRKLFIGNEFGVSTFDKGMVEPLSIPEIENAGVISIHSFRDSLILMGSGGGGVAIYHPATRLKKLITTHQGLQSDFIYFVAGGPGDFLWIGTEKGITRLKLNRELEITENLHYDYDNGLTGVETNQNAFYLSDDYKLFGLIDGLYQFNDLHREGRMCFDLHLTSVELFYGEYPVREYADSVSGFFKLPVRPSLPPEINHITFRYNRVDKRYPKSVKFKYFLENFDKTWSPPSSNGEVTYSNLPPGRYTFRVMATDNQGSWSQTAIAYPFNIRTPFYRTTSFLVGLFILLAGAVTLILYIRVKNRVNKLMMMERVRAKEQETLRKEIARDFHDEMGNQLTRIINYVSLLKLNGSTGIRNGNHTDLYKKVEDSAKYLYTGTRDFIWSIDPGNDELSKLFLHIRDFAEKLFEEKNISFRAYNEVKEPFKLPYGFCRQANLIFKEAMTNAFKYSEARNVSLSLIRIGDAFEMSFEDDGIGFYTGDIEKSNGLKNIRERADRINALLRIQSNKNRGTRIVLNFKLNKTLKYGLTL